MAQSRLLRFAVATLAAAGLAAGMSSVAHAQPDPKVIGGSDASTDDYPWVVALSDNPTASRSGQFCGGTLASATKVVTAAHCMQGESPDKLKVIIGRTDLNAQDTGTVVDTTAIWVHPDFSMSTLTNDVAVITLATAVDTPTLPIGTAADDLYQPGTPATLLGWGKTDNSAIATVLQQGDLGIISDDTCAATYSNFVQTAHVCSGSDTSRQCNGDSGGPLVVNGKLAGIVSFSKKPCVPVNAPGVLTRVATYADVINEQIGTDS